jgi:phosphohistidine phosphatase SixA
MQIIFVRHGTRERTPGVLDRDQPLSSEGTEQVDGLRRFLGSIGIQPTRCLSSAYSHARQTAERLLGGPMPDRQALGQALNVLTPKDSSDGIEAFVQEAHAEEFLSNDIILVVGHEPRLSRLLAKMTSRREPPLTRAGAVCVSLPSYEAILIGKGKVEWSWPVETTRAADLEAKLSSKMEVSGILAGLTVTAVAVLLGNRSPTSWQLAATSLLTVSAALFVASLYAYDRLMMPEEFWTAAEPGSGSKLVGHKQFRIDRNSNGILYAEMVWTWKYIFTPALFFATLGYLATLADVQGGLPPTLCSRMPGAICDRAVFLIAAIVILFVAAFYRTTRARLGVD